MIPLSFYVNNKTAEQTVCLHRLIIAIRVRESIIVIKLKIVTSIQQTSDLVAVLVIKTAFK